ncbi:GumC family protein [Caloranaerobacter sp. DY30410]|uniref:GumC family protein n=1 Tax=Caloranaerobacter sp. DY30410 TaxID=3238305 RepID=UPI003D027D5F
MSQIDQQNYYYDEISLRELIEVLLKGWKLIAIITVISLLTSGIFSFFIIDPTYEARTTLMASFATDKLVNQKSPDDIQGILDTISTYPIMTIQTYKEQIKNPEILQQTIDELGLDKEEFTLNTLRNMIKLETIKDTNLIAVKVKYTDPELAAKIANTVAQKFTSFISNMAKQQASKSSQFIQSQLEVEKKKLDDALLELKQFLSQPRGVDELKAEVSSKLNLLTGYKTQLVQKEVALNKLEAALEAAEKELRATPKVLVTKKSISEDPILSQLVTDASNLETKDVLSLTMENEQINSNYLSLNNKISNYKISIAETSKEIEDIKNKIEITKKELEKIQVELAEKEHQQKLIQRKVNLAQSTYDAFLKKYEETRIAESSEIGDSSILIVSKAVVPETPVSPKKMLNLAIAGVLGIMIGVFVVFFKEYWESSVEEETSKVK